MAKSSETKGPSSRRGTEAKVGVQSVGKALAVLELFNEDHPAMSISEIAAGTGLNRATTYRFCQTLLALGYLEEMGNGELRPGLKAISLARAALSSRELPELAVPYLRDLQSHTHETVNMALLDGDEVVYVARLLSDHLLALRLFVGSRLSAVGSSLGRAMVAFLPDEEIDALIAGAKLQSTTQRSITDPDKLRAELRKIRSRGYAVNDQELVIGVTGVAAPVFGLSGKPLAAINLSISRPVKSTEVHEELAPMVLQTARSISDLATRLALDSV
ncbi:MAG: IclR family transcriptional regulator [Actinobacteria bacterium]|nr:IclR family transcriptional regulator [Actinomycetota bacterium]